MWPKADIRDARQNVRFRGVERTSVCLQMTRSGSLFTGPHGERQSGRLQFLQSWSLEEGAYMRRRDVLAGLLATTAASTLQAARLSMLFRYLGG